MWYKGGENVSDRVLLDDAGFEGGEPAEWGKHQKGDAVGERLFQQASYCHLVSSFRAVS